MNTNKFALVCCFLAILQLSLGQSVPPPAPCFVPTIYTTAFSQYITEEGCSVEYNLGEYYVDLEAELVRVDIPYGYTVTNGVKSKYSVSVYQVFKQQAEYLVDRVSGTCYKLPLSIPIGTGEVPPQAEFLAEIVIGQQPINQYSFKPTNPSLSNITVEVGLSVPTCFPVLANFFNTTLTSQPTLFMAELTWNTIPQVPPFTFNLPAQCTGSSLVHMSPYEMIRGEAANLIRIARKSLRHKLWMSRAEDY